MKVTDRFCFTDTGTLFRIQPITAEQMVKVGETIKDYSCDGGGMFLVLRDTLVVGIPFCVPYFIIAEVVAFRISKTETDGRDTFHCEVCMV